MSRWKNSWLILVSLGCLNAAEATPKALEEDIEHSRGAFLISDPGPLISASTGTLTLCLTNEEKHTQAAVVIEIFNEETQEIEPYMIYTELDPLCGGCAQQKKIVHVKERKGTLKRVFRSKDSNLDGEGPPATPPYSRRFRWVLPEENLKNAIRKAQADARNKVTSGNFAYLQKMMDAAGLEGAAAYKRSLFKSTVENVDALKNELRLAPLERHFRTPIEQILDARQSRSVAASSSGSERRWGGESH